MLVPILNWSRTAPGTYAFAQEVPMRDGSRVDELLTLLLWTVDTWGYPSWRKLHSSFEAWAYGNGFLHQIRRLERARLVERRPGQGTSRYHRLTDAGRLRALGGRDPERQWSRPWDGRWRVVLFDIPVDEGVARNRLRRQLRHLGFGCLQGSVWVTPDDVSRESAALRSCAVDAGSLVAFESRTAWGEHDPDLVSGAWDFDRINTGYQRYLEHVREPPADLRTGDLWDERTRRWLRREIRYWGEALDPDPLLPKPLHPRPYLGPHAWLRRRDVLGPALQQARIAFPDWSSIRPRRSAAMAPPG